jgi:hypothetical protein
MGFACPTDDSSMGGEVKIFQRTISLRAGHYFHCRFCSWICSNLVKSDFSWRAPFKRYSYFKIYMRRLQRWGKKSTHGKAKSTHGEAKPTHGEAKSTHGEAKPTHGGAKSTHGKHSWPMGKQSQPIGQQSGPMGKQSRPIGKQSRPMGKQSRPMGKQSQPMGKQSWPMGRTSKPWEVNLQTHWLHGNFTLGYRRCLAATTIFSPRASFWGPSGSKGLVHHARTLAPPILLL